MEQTETSLQEITAVQLVCVLEDVLDQVTDDTFEPVARKIIGDTLDRVQGAFYLVPKAMVQEDGGLAERELPKDALDTRISDIWNNVSS